MNVRQCENCFETLGGGEETQYLSSSIAENETAVKTSASNVEATTTTK